MITFRQKGDFSKLSRFLERAKEAVKLGENSINTDKPGLPLFRLQLQWTLIDRVIMVLHH